MSLELPSWHRHRSSLPSLHSWCIQFLCGDWFWDSVKIPKSAGAQFPHTKWHSNGTRPTHTHPPVCFKFSPDTLPNSISILYKYLIILRCLGNNGKGESLCVSNTERIFLKCLLVHHQLNVRMQDLWVLCMSWFLKRSLVNKEKLFSLFKNLKMDIYQEKVSVRNGDDLRYHREYHHIGQSSVINNSYLWWQNIHFRTWCLGLREIP